MVKVELTSEQASVLLEWLEARDRVFSAAQWSSESEARELVRAALHSSFGSVPYASRVLGDVLEALLKSILKR